MRSFLLLLGTQILSQIAADGHGDANVCAATFFDHSIAAGYKDASNAVVIVLGDDELPAGNMIELGAMVTEEGAWLDISDGAFVTINTDKLDCGLEGCTDSPPDSTDYQIGYDTHSDELVSCDGDDGHYGDDDGHHHGHDDEPDEPKVIRLVLEGNFNEVVGDNKDEFLSECTDNLSKGGASDVECLDVRPGSIIVDVGGSDPGEIAAAVKEVRASGLDLPSFDSLEPVKPSARVLEICPKLDQDRTFEEGGNWYCSDQGHALENLYTFEDCKSAGEHYDWNESRRQSCGEILTYIKDRGGLDGDMDKGGSNFRWQFMNNCCDLDDDSYELPTDNCEHFDKDFVVDGASLTCTHLARYVASLGGYEDMTHEYHTMAYNAYCCGIGTLPTTTTWYYPYPTPPYPTPPYSTPKPYPTPPYPTPPAPESCPKTCSGKTCDEWLQKTSFTCSSLEDTYGCNCGGCECTADVEQETCAADLCFERTCPEWEGKHGVKCEILKDVFGCSCNGCNCAETVHKCGSPEHKGDNYCDDNNNVKTCGWDGGDCCHLDGNYWEHENQFVYCKDCACRDPEGTPINRDCALKQYQGDGMCDDGNNEASCGWDGGDCCGDVNTKYCDDCLCLDPYHTGSRCISSHHGDGFCDDANNNAACDWDGGDCCTGGNSAQFRYCKECACKDPAAHWAAQKCEGTCGSSTHAGDKYCDDDNNNCGCGWDGGDCCGKTGNVKQYEYCFQCACLNTEYVAPPCPVAKFQGDGICDDDNNVESCNWDDGDCCDKGGEGNKNQFKFCKKCEDHYC